MGLLNLGNTCYINASLQAFVQIKDFADIVRNGHGNCKISSCVSCLLRKTVLQWTHSVAPIRPTLAENLLLVNSRFHVGDQKDAHEFLMDLLNKVIVGNSMQELFSVELEYIKTCTSCGLTSSTSEDFAVMNISVSLHKNTQAAVYYHFAAETMEFQSDCGHSHIKRSHRIKKAPKVLIVQLKRFDRYRKLSTKVVINDMQRAQLRVAHMQAGNSVCDQF